MRNKRPNLASLLPGGGAIAPVCAITTPRMAQRAVVARDRRKPKPALDQNMQYIELRKVFGALRPSVALFDELLQSFPAKEKEVCYEYAFYLFMNEYYTVPERYRIFLLNLVKQKPEEFLRYLLSVSGLPEIQCKTADPILLLKVFHMLAAKEGNVKSSFDHLSLCIKLGFKVDLKIKTLAEYIRRYKFIPETFFELAEYVQIYF